MKRSYIKNIKAGETVLLTGWIYEIRYLHNIIFLLLRDSSGIVQCVLKKPSKENFTLESVIEIKGIVKKAKIKANYARKDIEVEIKNVKILNKSEKLPLQVNEKAVKAELPTRLDLRFLDIRKPRVQAIFKIQSVIINSFRNFFYNQKFIEIQPPGIIATSTEGGTDLFEINYFGKKAYLAQSPQLYKQLAAISLEKVFSTSPVWRAEKHDTSRHINEIRQMDIEVAFADDMEVMAFLEDSVKFIIKELNKNCSQEIKILNLKLKIPNVKYFKYSEAVDYLNKNNFKIKYGEDFEPEAEKKLCESFPDKIIFVYDWPISLKPFYIWPKNQKKGISAGFDALYGGVEISSGGQRVHIPDILIEQLKLKKLNPKDFKWYIDAFRYGAPKHAGWSIGLERLTQAILRLENIREGTLFPRDRRRLTP